MVKKIDKIVKKGDVIVFKGKFLTSVKFASFLEVRCMNQSSQKHKCLVYYQVSLA